MSVQDLEGNISKASALLKAMCNQTRLEILCKLSQGEMSVGALTEGSGLTQSGLSQHLGRLRRDQLVKTRRDRQTIYYSIKSDDVQSVLDALHDLYCGAEEEERVQTAA